MTELRRVLLSRPFISGYRRSCIVEPKHVTDRHVTTRNTHRRPLTDLQQAILDFIWSNGPSTSEQVRLGLLPHHRLKDSSVRTLLRRLEQRDYLTHRTDGKVYVYEATARRTHVAAKAVRQIIDRFWSGSAEQFLAGMVDEQVLTAAAIRRLAKKVGKS
jgi:predicted transcriptional regulator